jgi:macrolide transport system ATP-binding/permease protein
MRVPGFLRSFSALFGGQLRLDGEIREELRSHIQHRADDLVRQGLSRKEAERRARIEFGGYEKFKEDCYEEQSGHFLETVWQDARFAVRLLSKSPGFTGIAVITLALGIAANAVAFSLMNALILRPLHVPHAQNLYTIERAKADDISQSYPDYVDLRDRNRTLDGIVAYSITRAGLDSNGKASSAWLYQASGNYFDVLGIQPYLGRFFHSSDEHGANSAAYLVLSYPYWQNHFGGDPNIVGRMVQVNKHPFMIIGVAPEAFRGTEMYFIPNFWVPLVSEEQSGGWFDLNKRGSRGLWLVGRLKAGVTPAQATADLNSVGDYLEKSYPQEDQQISFALTRPGLIGDTIGRPVRAFVTGLMLLATLILLAACANLGSLFAARAADRSKEVALRLALGSSRNRILRQLMTEAMMVSLIGGSVGLISGIALLRWLNTWQPVPSFPVHLPVAPDATTYAVALLLALGSGLLFGMVPVRQVLRVSPYQVVKSGMIELGGRRFNTRDLLLVVQVAVCATLVTASMVALRGLVRSLHTHYGFVPQQAVLVETDLNMAGYEGDRVPTMQRRMVDAVEKIPGVIAAGLTDRIPLDSENMTNSTLVFEDRATDLRTSNAAADTVALNISPGYFRAAGTALLVGRAFTAHDDAHAPRVAVVNRAFAMKVFGALGSMDNAIGRYFKTGEGTRIQVVGIVEDGKYKTVAEGPQPAIFLPILQSPSSATWLVIRSGRDPREMAVALDSGLRGLDEGMPFSIRTWTKELDSALFASRVTTVSLGILGGLGAMLAVTGIFGLASYSVAKRMRELGIRIALGAQRREVLHAALGKALRLLAFGSGVGLFLGILASKGLAFIAYQGASGDPLVLAGVVGVMILLGLVATFVPAFRALGADPLLLLREE